MLVRGAFLDPDHQAVHAVGQCLALAQMAHARLNLTTALALVALLLELLDHAWSDLLTFHDLSFALASGASSHIIGVVCSTATTVRADNFTIVLHFKVGS